MDIVRTADVAIVTVVPGAGDDVQALKAGIMEIADIFVVNKADRDGADRTAQSIEAMLTLEPWPPGRWRPPVLRTIATTGAGVPELVAMVERFRRETGEAHGARRRARAEWRLREILERRFMQHLERDVLEPGEFERLLDGIGRRETDPYAASASVLARALDTTGSGHLDHLGVATADAAEFIDLFARLFGFTTGEPEDVGQHRVRFVETGDTTIELVEPRSPESPVAKFLRSRGAGLHHLCLRVPDIDQAMAVLRQKGVRFIDEAPRPGAHGSRIAFIHPTSTAGLLVELKQKAG